MLFAKETAYNMYRLHDGLTEKSITSILTSAHEKLSANKCG